MKLILSAQENNCMNEWSKVLVFCFPLRFFELIYCAEVPHKSA